MLGAFGIKKMKMFLEDIACMNFIVLCEHVTAINATDVAINHPLITSVAVSTVSPAILIDRCGYACWWGHSSVCVDWPTAVIVPYRAGCGTSAPKRALSHWWPIRSTLPPRTWSQLHNRRRYSHI